MKSGYWEQKKLQTKILNIKHRDHNFHLCRQSHSCPGCYSSLLRRGDSRDPRSFAYQSSGQFRMRFRHFRFCISNRLYCQHRCTFGPCRSNSLPHANSDWGTAPGTLPMRVVTSCNSISTFPTSASCCDLQKLASMSCDLPFWSHFYLSLINHNIII